MKPPPSSAALADLGEDQLISLLTRNWRTAPPLLVGPGDDCAVLRAPGSHICRLLKTDAIVEAVHFTPDEPARWIGWKALARCVSDIAAMGGQPEAALITLAAPRTESVRRIQSIYRGIAHCARVYGVILAGGESTSADRLLLSVAMTGSVSKPHLLLRSGARPGHLIWVTGRLGGSRRGKHLRFKPRLAEAQWLAASGHVTAMMDLSDGIARDLPRLGQASATGFRLDFHAVPKTAGCTLPQALCDGEDYELLFATPPGAAPALTRSWPFRLKLTQIGVFESPTSHNRRLEHLDGYDAYLS